MEAYRERVEKLARKRNGEPIYNGSYDHAAIIVENMFAQARNSVCILSGRLNARVYGPTEVVEQAGLFLADPKHTARILVEDGSALSLEHPFLSRFWDNENVQIRAVSEKDRALYDFHFLVMDSDSYRFEKDKTVPAAVAAFGDSQGAANLEKVFEVLWTRSTERLYAPKKEVTP